MRPTHAQSPPDPSEADRPTDEQRLARLSSALCIAWSMVHRGIWPHQLLNRYFPREIVRALPPFERDLTGHDVSRTTYGLVSITNPTLAYATKALLHPEGPAEAILLSFERETPQHRWQVTRFVPIRYRDHHLALAHVELDAQHRDSGLRPDIVAVLGPPPRRADLRADYLDAVVSLSEHATRYGIKDLSAHLRRPGRLNRGAAQDHARAVRTVEQYKLLAKAGDERLARHQFEGPARTVHHFPQPRWTSLTDAMELQR